MTVIAKGGLGFLALVAVMALVLFGGAGTLRYTEAWVYLGIFVTASLLITLYVMKNDPALLARRVDAGPWAEKRLVEQVIMTIASLGFIGILLVPALDHRFHWSTVPLVVAIAGDVLTALSFVIIFFVYKENTFTSAIVDVMPDQHVVDTGPYSVVRHPMYAGALLLFIGTPLALGSWWGLAAFGATFPALLWRLFDEEALLSRSLPGYTAYCSRVRWRMVPGVF